MNNRKKRSNNNKFFGLLILLFGILLLIDRLLPALDFLDWIFSLPMILILGGLLLRARSRSNQTASWILITVGAFFLFADLVSWEVEELIWPMIIIGIGMYIITGKRRRRKTTLADSDPDDPIWDKRIYDDENTSQTDPGFTPGQDSAFPDSDGPAPEEADQGWGNDQRSAQDFIESTSVFGNTRNFVVSKNFRGGDIVNIMGGSEINLMQADLHGPAVLEVVQLFGGTTIVAPSHWVVIPEMAAIFGGVEDKRYSTMTHDKSKVLYIKGTSLFGGITIKSL